MEEPTHFQVCDEVNDTRLSLLHFASIELCLNAAERLIGKQKQLMVNGMAQFDQLRQEFLRELDCLINDSRSVARDRQNENAHEHLRLAVKALRDARESIDPAQYPLREDAVVVESLQPLLGQAFDQLNAARKAMYATNRSWRVLTRICTAMMGRWLRTWNHSSWLDISEHSDIIQNALLGMMRKLPAFKWQGRYSFRGWIKRITYNQSVTYLRQRKRHAAEPLDRIDPNRLTFDSQDEAFYSKRLVVEIERLLGDDLQAKELLELRCQQELTFVEIAERLKITPGSVRMRWLRLRKTIMPHLQFCDTRLVDVNERDEFDEDSIRN